MSLPIQFQPSELIKDASLRLSTEHSLDILDIGSHVGRNSVYLASLGHNVIGLTDQQADVDMASEYAQSSGVANNCQFTKGDMRDIGIDGPFDVVLMNEVLHLVTPIQADNVVKAAQSVTRQGGLHFVSGYMVDPHKANRKNREHMFWPGQLQKKYQISSWDILAYTEDEHQERMFGSKQLIDSLATVVAQKSW